jgi:hypothetical protein
MHVLVIQGRSMHAMFVALILCPGYGITWRPLAFVSVPAPRQLTASSSAGASWRPWELNSSVAELIGPLQHGPEVSDLQDRSSAVLPSDAMHSHSPTGARSPSRDALAHLHALALAAAAGQPVPQAGGHVAARLAASRRQPRWPVVLHPSMRKQSEPN